MIWGEKPTISGNPPPVETNPPDVRRLGRRVEESSNGWNNAGTGHSALCEPNYTPEANEDGDRSTVNPQRLPGYYYRDP